MRWSWMSLVDVVEDEEVDDELDEVDEDVVDVGWVKDVKCSGVATLERLLVSAICFRMC